MNEIILDKEIDSAIENIRLLFKKVKRNNFDKLVTFLEDSNYFTAPASKSYHLACKGGLALHCWFVYNSFKEKLERLKLQLPEESIIITSFLHDVVKLRDYKYIQTEDKGGHGVVSINILRRFITLTPEEVGIIGFHMSIWGVIGFKNQWNYEVGEYSLKELREAVSKHEQIKAFINADVESEIFERKTYNKILGINL